jgi:beta-galactosidase
MPGWTRRDLLKAGVIASAGFSSIHHAAGLVTSSTGSEVLDSSGTQLQNVSDLHGFSSARQRLLFDFGWKFHLGNANDPAKDFEYGKLNREAIFAKADAFSPVATLDFKEDGWRSIDLPHDWSVELPFTDDIEPNAHGAKPVGRNYPETSIGWYRRVFEIPKEDLGKRIVIEFDGVFRDAVVILNGHFLGRNLSGYLPFSYDVTDYLDYGAKNVLAVRVDASLEEGWFYDGAGIYRHVWLTKYDPLHIRQWGIYVRSEFNGDAANLLIDTEVTNDSTEEREFFVTSRIVDHNGKILAAVSGKPTKLASLEGRTISSKVPLPAPRLWSLEDPYLYQIVTTIESSGQVVDHDVSTFGIRKLRFEADRGFFLNDKPVKIKGTCNHQDHAGVGAAIPDRLQVYRVEKLKEFGSNACRTTRNPATPECLDACDRLGMLVMSEVRMMASTPEGLGQLERMIRRDRNHPSIFIWSLANEEPVQGDIRGERIVATMKALAKKLDSSRPVTGAMNGGFGSGISNVADVQEFNYHTGDIDEFHKKFPQQPIIGSETASAFSTRGAYEDSEEEGFVSAYDIHPPGYGDTAEGWWSFYAARPFLAGGFVWTGFDYRGEPSPYWQACISSQFGILDTCGFPKDAYYYYKSWWGTEPVLHVFPHWDWPDKLGKEIDVWCYSNLESVELFLNGKSLGSKKISANSHASWKVRYEPGVLEARGSRDGQIVLSQRRETTTGAASIALRADRSQLRADGEDVAMIAVEIQDTKGRTVPTASERISFKLTGPGKILGVGNGDPSSREADKPHSAASARRSAFHGLCMVILQTSKEAGTITLIATGDGLDSGKIVLDSTAMKPRLAVE